MKDQEILDVIIIGGSYAGLSAAMSLGRSLRNVLVIDGGSPCNRFTPHSQNFLTNDGKKPSEIAAVAKEQVQKYPTVKFFNGQAIKGTKTPEGFEIETASGEVFTALKLIFATGLKDLMPDIKGFTECWGISVVHCPYCHGYEYHHQPTGILANGEMAYHYAQLVSNLTKQLTIFTNGKPEFSPEQTERLKQHGISVVEKEVDQLQHQDGFLSAIIFKDETYAPLKAVYSRPVYEQHCKIPEQLGCELNEQGLLKIEPTQRTTIPGVFAAGDNSSFRSVATAVAAGNLAGATCNKELIDERWLRQAQPTA